MANVKISELPAATTPLTGAELVPVVQSGVTDQVTVANLTAGRAVSASDVTVTGLTASQPVFTDASKKLVSSATVPVANGGTGLASWTSNGLVYASGTTTLANSSKLTYNGTALTVSNNAIAITSPAAAAAFVVGGADGANTGTAIAAFAGIPTSIFQRANGTNAAPTALLSGEIFGYIGAKGYGTSAYSAAQRAAISFVTAENWSNTANGAYINFTVTPAGGTSTTEVAVINDIGCLDIGRAAVSGPALSPTAPARVWVRSGNPYTDKATAASGTVAHGTFSSFGADGLAATNASVTYTNASTVYIAGAPSAGTNVTITNPWAQYIAAGKSYLGDQVDGNAAFVDSVGFRGTPVNSQSAAYQLVAADAGKTILHPIADNNARTFTIPANGTVPFPVGTTITFINLINTVTIAITTDTMYLAGAGTTGSRTLAAYGMATAVKVASTTWVISGNGLT